MTKLVWIALALTTALVTNPAFAAKFSSENKMKNTSAQKLFLVAKQLTKNEQIYGDASFSSAYSFTRKDSEENIKTVKQLNFMKCCLNSDDSGAEDMQKLSIGLLTEHLFEYYDFDDLDKAQIHDVNLANISEALKRGKSRP